MKLKIIIQQQPKKNKRKVKKTSVDREFFKKYKDQVIDYVESLKQ